MELMSRDFGELAHITCSVQRQKWSHILDCIKLTPSQRESMMATRKEHLNKLRATYQERQELNFKVAMLIYSRYDLSCKHSARRANMVSVHAHAAMAVMLHGYTMLKHLAANPLQHSKSVKSCSEIRRGCLTCLIISNKANAHSSSVSCGPKSNKASTGPHLISEMRINVRSST